MKTISRMLIFSAVSLYLTSLWNKGFIVRTDIQSLIIVTILLAAICYAVIPFSRVVFFPLNLLSLGFFSGILYIILIFALDHYVGLIHIKPWVFAGFTYQKFHIDPIHLGYLQNLSVSSFSLSAIINLLERIV